MTFKLSPDWVLCTTLAEYDRISLTLTRTALADQLSRAHEIEKQDISLDALVEACRVGNPNLVLSPLEMHSLVASVNTVRNMLDVVDHPTPAVLLERAGRYAEHFNSTSRADHALMDYLSIKALQFVACQADVKVEWPDTTPIERVLGLK